MSGPRVVPGARAPLFDRLVPDQADPSGARHAAHLLDPEGLRLSIVREVGRLLNTRTPLPVDRLDRRPRSTLDYGIPDLSLFWPFDGDSEARLVGVLERSIAAFEPRLKRPKVVIERPVGERRALLAHVSGEISTETLVERIAFPVAIRDGLGEQDEQ